MKLLKKWWIWLIIILLLIVFLYPKLAGRSGGGYSGPTPEHPWRYKSCSCFGYKYDAEPNLRDSGHQYKCIGIPYSCECIESDGNSLMEISC